MTRIIAFSLAESGLRMVKKVERIAVHKWFSGKKSSLLMLQLVHLAPIKWKVLVSQLLELFIMTLAMLSVLCIFIIFFSTFSFVSSMHSFFSLPMTFYPFDNGNPAGRPMTKKWVILRWMITNTWIASTNKRELNMNEDEQRKMCKRTFSLLTITITNHLHTEKNPKKRSEIRLISVYSFFCLFGNHPRNNHKNLWLSFYCRYIQFGGCFFAVAFLSWAVSVLVYFIIFF